MCISRTICSLIFAILFLVTGTHFPHVLFDCHMMVAKPETQIEAVSEANATDAATGRSLTQCVWRRTLRWPAVVAGE
jgi:heme/copper-type cytochrome/quinol oxidase subunit 3